MQTPIQFLRLPEVIAKTGLSRSQLYSLAAAGRFPKPIKLTERSSAWSLASVEEWMLARLAAANVV